MIPSFQTTFAVPMHCDSCVSELSHVLKNLNGVVKVDADLEHQLVAVEGNAAPSLIVNAIQATGRDAILRGSGAPDSAAVCILETHSSAVRDHVRGLARFVQVSPSATVVDLSLHSVSPGRYFASVRKSGNISEGPETTGDVWDAAAAREGGRARGILGTVDVAKSGVGTVFVDKPIQIWELIGRSLVVSKVDNGKFSKEDPDTLVGVIARSAGVWDNDKTVCSCSGKTVWEERKEQVGKGML